MSKKVYHGFDIEEVDLSGISDIIATSQACESHTFNDWIYIQGPYEIIKDLEGVCYDERWDGEPITLVYK